MRIEEIRAMPTERLQTEAEGVYKELFNLRFQRATRQMTDSNAIRKARQNTARVLTVLRERELALAQQQKGS